MPVARCRSCRLAARTSCRTWSTCRPAAERLDRLDPVLPHDAPPPAAFRTVKSGQMSVARHTCACATVSPCRFPRSAADRAPTRAVREGDLLWTPSADRVAGARLTEFTRFAETRTGRHVRRLRRALGAGRSPISRASGRRSGTSSASRSSAPHDRRPRPPRPCPGPAWFPGARLNYAEHVLRQRAARRAGAAVRRRDARRCASCRGRSSPAGARVLATQLRAAGVGPGDRVVAYLPNIPQAVIAMLATTSIGAIWASCSPDFGGARRARPARQLDAEGAVLRRRLPVRRQGLRPPRRDRADHRAGCPACEHVIHVPVPRPGDRRRSARRAGTTSWTHPPVPGRGVRVRAGAVRPSAVGPVLLRHHRAAQGDHAQPRRHPDRAAEAADASHMDLRPGDRAVLLHHHRLDDVELPGQLAAARRACRCSTTATRPTPTPDVLWQMAQDAGARRCSAPAPPTSSMHVRRPASCPRRAFDLSALDAVMLAGSPVSAGDAAPGSTATSRPTCGSPPAAAAPTCCTGFVGGVPTLPVYAGEIQARSPRRRRLRVRRAGRARRRPGRRAGHHRSRCRRCRSASGATTTASRYRAAYFDDFPGVWRHGDFFRGQRARRLLRAAAAPTPR